MRVVWVIDNHGTTKTITILSLQVGVVPESTCNPLSIRRPRILFMMLTSLICSIEVVKERVARGNGTLVDESGAVGPVGTLLEETVPVLTVSTKHQSK